MLDLLLWNGCVMTERGVLHPGYLGVAGGRIALVDAGQPPPTVSARRHLDLEGAVLAPGLIDLHMHGGKDHDTMDATVDALTGMARFAAGHGVTSFLAATMSSSAEALQAALSAVGAAVGRDLGGAALLGAYVEGPFLSGARAGAHDTASLRDAARQEIAAILSSGVARVVTLAPERPGAMDAIRQVVDRGTVVALAHTEATYDQMVAATRAGASLVTHLYNAMAPLHHREPGPIGAALTLPDLTCELIVDMVHLHGAVVQLALRAKGRDGIALVTDAMRGAGLSDGQYSLGGIPVTVAEGSARIGDGRLAGSVLTMDRAVRNTMRVEGLALEEAWRLGSTVPARVLGLREHKGQLAEGMNADLVICDREGHVRCTIVAGRVVYKAADSGGDL